ncbi:MAG: hypothetical protein NTZ59_02325 [Bacteroidetes bacterium]|nr:hypothetical protein [Bacteroidota bacterium]
MPIQTKTDYKQLVAVIQRTKRNQKQLRKHVPAFAIKIKATQQVARLKDVVVGTHWHYGLHNNYFFGSQYLHFKRPITLKQLRKILNN